MIRRFCAIAALLLAVAPGYAQFGGFGGPSILNRGGAAQGQQPDRRVQFSPFAGAMGMYSNRFNVRAADQGPGLPLGKGFGVNGLVGLRAEKSGRQSSTSFQLGANHGRYQREGIDGQRSVTGGFLGLSHGRQLTRQVNWFLSARMLTTDRSLQRGAFRADVDPFGDPSVDMLDTELDYFDNRMYLGALASGFSYQKSQRLTFSVQGGAFGAERPSGRFRDARGFMAGGAAQYRLTRQTFAGAQYSFGTFYFPGRFGESTYMSAQAFIGRRLNRTWSAQAGAGPLWVDSTRLASVPLDPFIAALTGQATALEILDRSTQTVAGQAALSGQFRKSSLQAVYMRGVMPGSAVYQSSLMERVGVNYNYSVARSTSVAFILSAIRMKALMQEIGEARMYRVGLSANRRLREGLSLSGSASFVRREIAGRRLVSDAVMVNLGVFYSPGELPFHVF